MTAPRPKAMVWLRRDLRIDDHAALYRALRSGAEVIPVFVFDTAILDPLPRSDRRVEFIHGSVAAVKAELNGLGGDLLVRHARAEDEIPRLAHELGVAAVYCNHDYEPDAIARDARVAAALQQQGIDFRTSKDQVVLERDEVLTASGGHFTVFTPYKKAWLRVCDDFQLKAYPVRSWLAGLAGHAGLDRRTPEPMPSLASLGFERTNLDDLGIRPGPEGAAQLFQDFLGRIDHYKARRDFPGTKGVSYLSVHLRFGTISIRLLARAARNLPGDGAATWLSELIWREFYHQILWHRPDVVGHSFKPDLEDLPFPNDEALFQAWCDGRTGFPLVDAAMRQLNETGYMHNRLRMVAASFLVKDLLVDWRWGERYFAEKLIDFDLAANNGGWQWAASTGCDAQPYFRIFNPTSQALKFDSEGRFIRRYVPELKALSAPAILAPWEARPLELAEGGVVLGKTYPHPIVDHARQRDLALALYKRTDG